MSGRPERLVVLASILIDVTVWVDRLPDRGGDLLARRGEATPGGAFNIIAAASRLGMPTLYAGIVGHGPFGAMVASALDGLGVAILPPLDGGQGDTGFDVAVVEKDAERTFITAPGAEARLDEAHLRRLLPQATDALYLSGYDLAYPISGPALADWVSRLEKGPLVFLDPGPLVADIPEDRLRQVLGRLDILSLSAREAALLVGEQATSPMIARLLDLTGGRATVILRQGAAGAVLGEPGRPIVEIPARPVQAVDSTGAGDVHGATLLARLAQGRALKEAVRDANAAASFAVAHEGPAVSPTLDELEAILAGW